ncbi:MAG: aldo/keto reductase [Actinomycetota bacterium]|nr:aldo/keto reductase [Actinomycetota bacterium]
MRYVEVQGERVPALGFGTWQLSGQAAIEAVQHALELGYRHIDTAQMYRNEAQVGQALADSGLDRSEIFLTTKLLPRNLEPDRVHRSTRESLERLKTDYVDLLLIHWPAFADSMQSTLEAMVTLRNAGTARHIGVSNFTPALLREALDYAPIFCNQVEYHPYLAQPELCQVAAERDLLLTAYSPLAKGRVVDDETLGEIGRRHDKTPTQVALRWLIQQDHVAAIPRSADREHRAANFDIFDFELSDQEMSRIDALDRDGRLIDPADLAPDWER